MNHGPHRWSGYILVVVMLVGWAIAVDSATSFTEPLGLRLTYITIWSSIFFVLVRSVAYSADVTYKCMTKMKQSNEIAIEAEDAIKQNQLGMLTDDECGRIVAHCRARVAQIMAGEGNTE